MPLRIRRGTNQDRTGFTPLEGELIYTTDTKQVYVGDGVTPGGNQIIADAVVNNLETNLDLNNFDIVGNGNININGNVIVAGNIDGNFVGTVDGDIKGSLFADDSTVLVDGLTGNHYGLFNGNVLGNVTGDLFGNVTGNLLGNVTGDVLGNVTGNLLGNVIGNLSGNVDGLVNGDLKGSVFADDSSVIVDSINNSVFGIFKGKINSPLNVRLASQDEDLEQVSIYMKTAPSKGRAIRIYGYKGTIDNPQQPDHRSRLSLGFNFWDGGLNTYDTKVLVNGYTQSDNTGYLYIGVKDTFGDITYGLRMNGSTGNSVLSSFTRITLDAPDTTINNLDVTGNGVFAGTVNAASFKGSVVGDDSSVIVDAINSTIAVSGFIQFGSYSKTDRDNLGAANGMVLYNTTSNRFQGYQNGAWINLDDGTLDP